MLRLHDTLRRAKVPFEPIDPDRVRMYLCGPTVYDFAHVGNARPVVAFDVLYRVLRHRYGAGCVTYARNVTDVDDKIIARAAERGEPISALTVRYTERYRSDMAALGALTPDIEPLCTEHIAEMIAMVERLIASGHGYEAEGHVLFSVPSMADYGRLSGRDRDEQIAGARVEVAPYKRDPADFVMWKPSKEGEPGWDSPWGPGRPGWHLECSAMTAKHLGEVFDIHAGGQDLIFPHHENEIAQSRCAHGTEHMARYWLHNGYLLAEGEKMSKSLGNFYTVHDLLESFPGEAIRLALLSAHYRAPLDFTKDGVRQAKAQLDRLYQALRGREATPDAPVPAGVLDALEDDLNTPGAISALHDLASRLNKAGDPDEARALAGALRSGGALVGLLEADPEAWFRGGATDDGPSAEEIDALIAERLAARKAKDFATADRIRNDLQARGVELQDGSGGSTWKRL